MAATSFSLKILFHAPLVAVSCNISFLLASISIKFSCFHGRYFIISCILSHFPLAAFHAIFHFSWHSFQSNFHFFTAATSFSLNFVSFPSGSYFMQYFIPPWYLFQSFFIFLWQLLHSLLDFVSFPSGSYFMWYSIPPGIYFHFFMVATSFSAGFCLIPLW